MSRTAARFTQADARRIIAAAAQARVPVAVEFLPVRRKPWDVNALRCLTPKTAPLKALGFFPAVPHVSGHATKGEW